MTPPIDNAAHRSVPASMPGRGRHGGRRGARAKPGRGVLLASAACAGFIIGSVLAVSACIGAM